MDGARDAKGRFRGLSGRLRTRSECLVSAIYVDFFIFRLDCCALWSGTAHARHTYSRTAQHVWALLSSSGIFPLII